MSKKKRAAGPQLRYIVLWDADADPATSLTEVPRAFRAESGAIIVFMHLGLAEWVLSLVEHGRRAAIPTTSRPDGEMITPAWSSVPAVFQVTNDAVWAAIREQHGGVIECRSRDEVLDARGDPVWLLGGWPDTSPLDRFDSDGMPTKPPQPLKNAYGDLIAITDGTVAGDLVMMAAEAWRQDGGRPIWMLFELCAYDYRRVRRRYGAVECATREAVLAGYNAGSPPETGIPWPTQN